MPPTNWFFSSTRTRRPSRARTAAAVSPLCPAPMTIASYCCAMCRPLTVVPPGRILAARARSAREPSLQGRPHRGPLRRDDGVQRAVARRALLAGDERRLPVPDHAVELPADALDRVPAALVAGVGLEIDALHAPRLERVREHQELGLGVDPAALRG